MQTESPPNPHSITRQAGQFQPRFQLKRTLWLKLSLPAFLLGLKLQSAAAFTASLLLVSSVLRPLQLTRMTRKPIEKTNSTWQPPKKVYDIKVYPLISSLQFKLAVVKGFAGVIKAQNTDYPFLWHLAGQFVQETARHEGLEPNRFRDVEETSHTWCFALFCFLIYIKQEVCVGNR